MKAFLLKLEKKLKRSRAGAFMNFTIGWKLLPLKIRYAFNHIKYLGTLPPESSPAQVLLVAHDNNRAAFKNGLPYAQLLDSLGDELEARGISVGSLASPYSALTGKRAYRNPASMDWPHFWYSLYKDTEHKKFHLTRMNAAYDRYLKRVGAKVMIACSPTLTVIRAAKRNGIAIYELMHGMGYTDIDSAYRKRQPADMPDYFLSMDHVTTNTLKRVVPEERIVGIRHPWLSRFEGPREVAGEWKLPEAVERRLKSFNKVVLFSLQWGYDGEKDMFAGIIENGILHSSVVKAIEESSDEIVWVLRLHPVQMLDPRYGHHRSFLKKFEREHPNVFGFDLSAYPIASLLAVADAHVTMCSMVCYEAAWMGVPSLALCPVVNPGGALASYFDDLKEAGLLDKSPVGKADLNAWVRDAHKRGERVQGVFYDDQQALEHIISRCRGLA